MNLGYEIQLGIEFGFHDLVGGWLAGGGKDGSLE